MPRKKARATAEERQYMSDVAELGCVICQRPAEIHHILTGVGMGQRASNHDIIPLCPDHHRLGGHGVAIHAGIKTFEANFGCELDLLEQVRNKIGE